jgi:hypothetical protein
MRITVPSEMTHGAIVAVAELHDVVRRSGATRFGRWFFGPFGFVLKNVRALPRPVPETGRLGLARASAVLQKRVEAELRRAPPM